MMSALRADARRWMYETTLALAASCLGVGASVGLTGVGALGNEPHYTQPADLAHDAAALKAAGVDDFAIYNLEGILGSACPG